MAGPLNAGPAPDPEEIADRIVDGLARPWMTGGLVAAILSLHGVLGLILMERGRTGALGVLIAIRPPRLLRRCGAMESVSLDRGELWRLVSANFLHVEGLHVLLNALALVALGRLCESVFGSTRLLWLFLVSGMSGAALSWLGGNRLSVGASSGVFGLMGAAIVFGWKYRAELPPRAGAFFRWKLLPWLLLNLALGLLPFIDALGHLGGLIGGSVLAMTLGNRVVPGESGRPLARVAMGLASALLLAWAAWRVSGKWT